MVKHICEFRTSDLQTTYHNDVAFCNVIGSNKLPYAGPRRDREDRVPQFIGI